MIKNLLFNSTIHVEHKMLEPIDKFNIVDMGGIDIVKSQGLRVEGLFTRLLNSIQNCKYTLLTNWNFAEIPIVPTYVELVFDGEEVKINDLISVTDEDVVRVYSLEEPSEPVITELMATENGTYVPEEGVDGFSPVTVNVDAETVYWNEPIIRNWDFSNPVNTRGKTSYVNEGSINGWICTSSTTCTIGDDGIYVTGENMYYRGRLYQDSFTGLSLTLTMLANNKVMTTTFTIDTGTSMQARVTIDGIACILYRDSASQMAIVLSNDGTGNSTLVQAVKLEVGESQTLAKQENSEWKLIRHQDDEEKIFIQAMAYNF